MALLAAIRIVEAQAAPQDYGFDANHTFATLRIKIKHLGISTQRGRFSNAKEKGPLDTSLVSLLRLVCRLSGVTRTGFYGRDKPACRS